MLLRLLLRLFLLQGPALPGQVTDDPLLAWLDRQAQQHLDLRERELAAVRGVEEARKRQRLLREQLLASMGGLVDYKGPLRARTTGRLDAGAYVIEKVIFESLPGIFVTGNLYRPSRPGRYPGVLAPSGHTQEGKPEPQYLAANLALKGFVVLTYDPIGQGEREQSYLPQLGRALSGGGGNEHLDLGARSILIGQSVVRYFLQDGMRGIDYLVSRADVDADRIGVTGCSGGGAITAVISIFDERVKVAAPGCFLSTYRTLFTGPTPDSEMTIPQFLARGMDQGDLFLVRAPHLSWLLMATTEDYFTPQAARPVYDEVRRWYGLYGAEERVRFHMATGSHGTPKESREAIYEWLNRWLRQGEGDATDVPVKLFTNLELRVTPSGNVDGGRGSRKVWQVIRDEFRKRRSPRPASELPVELQRLGIPYAGLAPAVEVLLRGQGDGYILQTLRFASEPGVLVRARLYEPPGAGRKPAVVIVEEKRRRVPLYVQLSQATKPLAEAIVRSGRIVLELEVRNSPDADEGRPFLGNWLTNQRADLVGRNLPAMRAHDIAAAAAVLAARSDVSTIMGYARGVKGFWMLLAAVGEPRLSRLWLDRTPWSLAAAFDAPLASFLFDAMIPGFALHWDFADLVGWLHQSGRKVFWTDPATWMNEVLRLDGPYRYRHVNEGDKLLIEEFFL